MKSSLHYIAAAILFALPYPTRAQDNEDAKIAYTSDGQYPYVAYLIVRKPGSLPFTCSGIIIDKYWVLTAAHCLGEDESTPGNIMIAAGKADMNEYYTARVNTLPHIDIDEKKYGVQERRVNFYQLHPLHDASGRHDVGLVKVDKPFKMTKTVKMVQLTKKSFNLPMKCFEVSHQAPSLLDITKPHQQYVKQFIANPFWACNSHKGYDVICSSKKISLLKLKKDFGGPLVCDGTVRGIASHVYSTKLLDKKEIFYADVYRNINWISVVTGKPKFSTKPNY